MIYPIHDLDQVLSHPRHYMALTNSDVQYYQYIDIFVNIVIMI